MAVFLRFPPSFRDFRAQNPNSFSFWAKKSIYIGGFIAIAGFFA
jgi:hypothetical protein